MASDILDTLQGPAAEGKPGLHMPPLDLAMPASNPVSLLTIP